MKKRFLTLTSVLLAIIGGYNFLYPKDIRILGKFDFSKGSWELSKGYSGDSVRYVITNPKELEKLKNEWVLSSTDRNFATTGGYTIHLTRDRERVLTMDLIKDWRPTLLSPGILAHYHYGTLAYSNLGWLEKGPWQKEVVKPH